jgi:hypothetical protein
MITRLLITTAIAALAIAGTAIGDTAQAAVVGPASAAQTAAQSLDFTQQVRRICRTRLVCERFPCRFVQQCYVTKDYPPEHGRR